MSTQRYEAPLEGPSAFREVIPVPEDYRVEVVDSPEFGSNGSKTVEVFWGGEAKVSADVNFNQGIVDIDYIGRPTHWGEDIRPAETQILEYRLGLDGILQKITSMNASTIEVSSHINVVALALMDHKVPDGWRRRLRVDSWSDSGLIDARQAIIEGAAVSFQYQPNANPQTAVGKLAVSGIHQSPELSVVTA